MNTSILLSPAIYSTLALAVAVFAVWRASRAQKLPNATLAARLVSLETRPDFEAAELRILAQIGDLGKRILRLEERTALADEQLARLRLATEAATKAGAAVADIAGRLGAAEAMVQQLSGVVRYELVARLAEDAVAYVEQMVLQSKDSWSDESRMNAAIDYATIQAKKTEVSVDATAIRLAIEAHVWKAKA